MSISALLHDTKNIYYAAPFHPLSFILRPSSPCSQLAYPTVNKASSVAALSRPICLQHFSDVGRRVSSCEIRGISGCSAFFRCPHLRLSPSSLRFSGAISHLSNARFQLFTRPASGKHKCCHGATPLCRVFQETWRVHNNGKEKQHT